MADILYIFTIISFVLSIGVNLFLTIDLIVYKIRTVSKTANSPSQYVSGVFCQLSIQSIPIA